MIYIDSRDAFPAADVDAEVLIGLVIEYCEMLRESGVTTFHLKDFAAEIGYAIKDGIDQISFEMNSHFFDNREVAAAQIEKIFFPPVIH